MKLIVSCLLLVSFTATAQLLDNTDYAKFSDKLTEPREYKFVDKTDTSVGQKVTYLGEIKLDDNTNCKVIVSHKNLSGKGVNDLIFVSSDKSIYIYRIDMPTDAPYKIYKNRLYFQTEDNTSTNIVSISTLPDLLCLPTGCFNKM